MIEVQVLVPGWRLPPRLSAAEVEARMRELADGASLQFFGSEEHFMAEKNTFLCGAMLRAVRALGGRPRFVRKTGTSDMNVVGPMWKCPIVAYGPGDARLDHTPEEHIDLGEFGRSIAVLHHALGEILLNGCVDEGIIRSDRPAIVESASPEGGRFVVTNF